MSAWIYWGEGEHTEVDHPHCVFLNLKIALVKQERKASTTYLTHTNGTLTDGAVRSQNDSSVFFSERISHHICIFHQTAIVKFHALLNSAKTNTSVVISIFL